MMEKVTSDVMKSSNGGHDDRADDALEGRQFPTVPG